MLFLGINQYLDIGEARQFYHAQARKVIFPNSELKVRLCH